MRDLVAGTTIPVSVSTNGDLGDGASRSAVMTPDGRYVAFVSAANNLVPGDTNGIADVFLRDLQLGTTVLVSVGAQFGSALERPTEARRRRRSHRTDDMWRSTARQPTWCPA